MRRFITTLVLAAVPIAALAADQWPQWRGPRSIAVSAETGLPTRWSATENVAWTAPLAGLGVSSPIVWGDRAFVTSQAGRSPLNPGSHPTLAGGRDVPAEMERPLGGARGAVSSEIFFVVEAFRHADGERLWERRVRADGSLTGVHEKHNLASATPATDGERVYASFGTGQVLALAAGDGGVVWQRHLGRDYGAFDIQWGAGSSPTLHDGQLILLCDNPTASYVVALDARTGETRWKVDRGTGRSAYSSPIVVSGPRGPELIVNSSERIDAYDPRTGEFLWHTDQPTRFAVPTPVFADGILYLSRGYRSGPYMAIRLGGRGDISKSHVAWRVGSGAPYISSILHYDGLIYMANDGGIATAVDAKTGERIWQQRLGGLFAASPVAADGKVYLWSETGETVVIRAGRAFELVARNDIGRRIVASPAISGGRIFIRTDGHLIAVGGQPVAEVSPRAARTRSVNTEKPRARRCS